MNGLLGCGMVLAACVLIYAAAPHQELAGGEMPRKSLGLLGAVLMGAGLLVLLTWAGKATAVFIGLTVAMLIWSLLPLALAWKRARRDGAS
ncbi:hypothetical protein [Pacificimonas flava]|uniref:Transmembrane protein n=1 Tax=Pacificimonas flava TaxID=1234595 RepID=M2U5K9_9SPHN|nr:hypothetical protein [Pacificimonas flava]EMD83302.1 hypothetical protein C725_1203 [Pacificimonas flava]MBB5279138.1 hypothetical protein [Pacificimonas flava]